jgi:inosine-uridine nucleoside N-ribohydrolase
MGGALDVPGNTSPVAEFNCFADPYAFQALLDEMKTGKFRFTFAPLDITTPHSIPFTDLLHPGLIPGADAAAFPTPTRLQAFTTAFLLRVRGLQQKFGLPDAMEMHDPVAVWYAIANAGRSHPHALADGWSVAAREFGVERCGQITRGMCVVDRRGTGESFGSDRTQNAELTGTSITGHDITANGTAPKAAPAAPVEPVETKPLPYMISRTPGSDVLRRVLLGRVFGTEV